MLVKLSAWLNEKYLDWQMVNGRAPIREFAAYIGVKPSTLSNWMNANIPPSAENIELLAAKLGPEIYDILGMMRPEMRDAYLSIPEELRDQHIEEYKKLVEKYLMKAGYQRE